MPSLSLSLLGSFQASLDERPLTGFESNKVRALLAYLAVEAEQPHSRDELIGLLWPDQPDRAARTNLQQALANLRQVIGDRTAVTPFLSATFDSIQFQYSEKCTIDVVTFAGSIAACHTHVHRRLETCRSCAQRLQQAVELYRDDFLAQFVQSGSEAFEEWALIQRERLHREALDALYSLAEHHAVRGEYDRVLRYATRQLELDPWREEAHRQLMRGLALSGQRSAALAQYETCRRVLVQELGAEPSQETLALQAKIKVDRLTHVDQKHNLPTALTSLIGRRRELNDLNHLLEMPTCRLLTLTGPGGIGKTRLALQAASDHAGLFADGVWLVELAALADPTLVPQAIASALSLREQSSRAVQDVLIHFLKSREVLLVLDNCEHLIEASARLADDLLRACPRLSIVATSREALKVAGEVVFQVPPLTTPDPQRLLARAALMQCDAVRLFIERAKAVMPSFEVHDANAPAIAQLCYHLDGIPLAIELAAARVRGLKAEQIAQRLDDRFRLLIGGGRTALPRHQTLRATIDWSYSLLTEQERTLFRRLSVFAGGWTIEAAEAVSSGDGIESPEVLDLLLHLMDKSLILMGGHNTETRYHMLETIREYAHDRLRESDEVDHLQQQHLAYFLQFAETDEPEPEADELHQWRQRLDNELDNLRAALDWSYRNNVALGLRLAGVVGRLCGGTLRQREALDWLQEFLGRLEVSSRTAEKAKALLWAGVIQRGESWGDQADIPSLVQQSRVWLEESLAIYRELRDQAGVADSLFELGWLIENQGNLEAGRELYTDSVRASQVAGDKIRTARGLNVLGEISVIQGDETQARLLHEEALRFYRESGRRYATRWPLGELGSIALGEGNLTAARSYSEESLALYREFNEEQNAWWVLLNLGEIAARQRRFDEARVYIDRSIALHQEGGLSLGPDFALLAFLAFAQSDYSQADELYRKSLTQLKDHKLHFPYALEGLAMVTAMQGQAKRAITLFGAAAALREALGAPPPSIYQADNERDMAVARAQLDEVAFNAAWEAGRSMTMEQTIDFAVKANDEAS